MTLVKTAVIALLVLTAGCAATPQPKPAQKAPSSESIASEVARICALPQADRDKALEKLKQDSGMVLFCGSGK